MVKAGSVKLLVCAEKESVCSRKAGPFATVHGVVNLLRANQVEGRIVGKALGVVEIIITSHSNAILVSAGCLDTI